MMQLFKSFVNVLVEGSQGVCSLIVIIVSIFWIVFIVSFVCAIALGLTAKCLTWCVQSLRIIGAFSRALTILIWRCFRPAIRSVLKAIKWAWFEGLGM